MADIKSPGQTNLAKYKLVFLGDQSVGKTSIINRFIYGTFDGRDHPTVGIDFISKAIFFDDKTIRLQLWDTAGQERFRSLIPSYIRDCSVAVIVYDITSTSSFQNISKWIEYVRDERGTDVIIALVGNKTDLEENRVVSYQEGELKAKENEVLFTEVSAKTDHNVQNLFKSLATHLTGSDASTF
mmetsp:Transcript_24159/g.21207  ORF Transcript_24159/g.21207 Transcript_24159/m.21207 type:complete len:184 (+) Transcript_24159:40-591(+)